MRFFFKQVLVDLLNENTTASVHQHFNIFSLSMQSYFSTSSQYGTEGAKKKKKIC